MDLPQKNQYINIHSHFKAKSKEEWVLRNAFHFPLHYHQLPYAVSVGVHPWHAYKDISQFSPQQFADVSQVLAIGEIGLDRVCKVPFELQKDVFEKQLQWAVELQKPVIIHSVKAYTDILPYMKKYYGLKWIIHGFNGNINVCKQMKDYDCYYSVGKTAFWKHWPPIVSLDRLMVETDNEFFTIKSVYEVLAQQYQLPLEEFQNSIFTNFTQIFNR